MVIGDYITAPWVCVECRIANKPRHMSETKRRCGRCGGDLIEMPLDYPIPKRSDKKAWASVIAKALEWKRLREEQGV